MASGSFILGAHTDRFNPHTAWEHLANITTVPHSFNSRANTDITRRYLVDQFKALQQEASLRGRRNVRYDDQDKTILIKSEGQEDTEGEPETDAPLAGPLTPEEANYIQGDNLVFWIGGILPAKGDDSPAMEIGFEEEQNALMVSAHYDSVSTSYGATDDGGGVAVILSMIQHFIHHPVQHTIIFLLNNGEEMGTLGSESFMGARDNVTTEHGAGHPWKKYIKAFINLEGAGSGGPSVVFQASGHDIVRHYALNAPYPHASVVANDLFNAGVIDSYTDFTVYSNHGLPGLDIAFYQRRSMYHSTTDWLPIESLHHMGSNAQATIRGLCNSDYLERQAKSIDDLFANPIDVGREEGLNKLISIYRWFTDLSVYYDILGRHMIVMELWSALVINAAAIAVGLPLLMLGAFKIGWKLLQSYDRNVGGIGRGGPTGRHRSSSIGSNNTINTQTHRLPAHSLRSVIDSSSASPYNPSDDATSPFASRNSTVNSSNFRRYGATGDPAAYGAAGPPELEYGRHYRRHIVRSIYVAPAIKTTFLIMIMIALQLTAIVCAALTLWELNPFIRYGQAWLTLAAFAMLVLFVQTFTVWLGTALERCCYGPTPAIRAANQWTFAIAFWWWLIVIIVGTGVASWLGTGAFYFTTILAGCSGLAALIQVLISFATLDDTVDPMDENEDERSCCSRFFCKRGAWARNAWVSALLVGGYFPILIVFDLLYMLVHMSAQITTGDDNATFYIVYGVMLIPILMPAVPAIARARHFKKILLIEALVATILFWYISMMAKPFDANSPLSLDYSQHYNQTARSSTIVMETPVGNGVLYEMLKFVPSIDVPLDIPVHHNNDNNNNSSHTNSHNLPERRTCKPIPPDMANYAKGNGCELKPERQVFEDDGWVKPVQVDWASRPTRIVTAEDGSRWREGHLRVLAYESRHCAIYVAQTEPGRETEIWTFEGELPGTPGEGNTTVTRGANITVEDPGQTGNGATQGNVIGMTEGRQYFVLSRGGASHHPKVLYSYRREWNRTWFAVVRVKLTKADEESPPTEGGTRRKRRLGGERKYHQPDTHHTLGNVNGHDDTQRRALPPPTTPPTQPQNLMPDSSTISKQAPPGTIPMESDTTGLPTYRVPIQVKCGYEDWSSHQGYASAFNDIRTHVPSWVRVKNRGGLGLFEVGVDLEF
ncbi:hypothetical protein DFQ27_005628 [Actinomortierella ambigua]|uniref:Peptide hydrolase n=1 Tax=Actinomortierella ambigua TaxID=1343610 RepID=A0A9P6U2C9_9FUNG|nr:hypothetical protein DFQ27_005628 [Actinomortierella ambigua]